MDLLIVCALELRLELRPQESIWVFFVAIEAIAWFASWLLSEHVLVVNGGFRLAGPANIHKHFDSSQGLLVLDQYLLAEEALYVHWQTVLFLGCWSLWALVIGVATSCVFLLVFRLHVGIALIYESYIDHLLNILSMHLFFSHLLSRSWFHLLVAVLVLKILRWEYISYLLFRDLIVLLNHLFELL